METPLGPARWRRTPFLTSRRASVERVAGASSSGSGRRRTTRGQGPMRLMSEPGIAPGSFGRKPTPTLDGVVVCGVWTPRTGHWHFGAKRDPPRNVPCSDCLLPCFPAPLFQKGPGRRASPSGFRTVRRRASWRGYTVPRTPVRSAACAAANAASLTHLLPCPPVIGNRIVHHRQHSLCAPAVAWWL